MKPYTFDDVAAALNGIVEDDWATFLRERLDGRVPLTGGIEDAGWKLVYKDERNAYAKAASAEWGGADFVYSLGFSVTREGLVGDVRWDSPAFDAGIAPGMTPVAVDGRAYTGELLEQAIKASRDAGLLIKSVKIGKDGMIELTTTEDEGAPAPDAEHEWDDLGK